MSQKHGVDDAEFVFGGGKLEVMLQWAFEEGPDLVDVGSVVGVEDDVAEYGRDSTELPNGLVNTFDEPPRLSVATLSHDE